MPDLIELRKNFSALVQKTRAFAQARMAAHPHGRVLAERVVEPGKPLQANAAVLPAAALAPGLTGGVDPRPPYAGQLDTFETQIRQCQRCPLGAKRARFVFGSGPAGARLAFVGVAPGAEEDEQGEPFLGESGALLNKIISAIGLTRDKVYLCTLLKCRPPLNRDPKPEETAACRPFLEHQLKLVGPRVLVTLGGHATHALIGHENVDIGNLRGRRFMWNGLPVFPTLHPSILLRDNSLKRQVWDDMKEVLRELNAPEKEGH